MTEVQGYRDMLSGREPVVTGLELRGYIPMNKLA